MMNDYYTVDEDNQTKGYWFIEYEIHDQASDAVKTYDGYKLNEQHIFAIYLFTIIDKFWIWNEYLNSTKRKSRWKHPLL